MNQSAVLGVDKTVSKINYVERHTDTCGQMDVTKLAGVSGNNGYTSIIQGDRGFLSSGT